MTVRPRLRYLTNGNDTRLLDVPLRGGGECPTEADYANRLFLEIMPRLGPVASHGCKNATFL